jgi:hypothetical protein
MDNEKLQNLLNIETQISDLEEQYDNEKIGLETLEADYILKNDWESVLGKPKPTQKEKDNYVVQQTEIRKRNLKKLERELKHMKRLYDIYMADAKH